MEDSEVQKQLQYSNKKGKAQGSYISIQSRWKKGSMWLRNTSKLCKSNFCRGRPLCNTMKRPFLNNKTVFSTLNPSFRKSKLSNRNAKNKEPKTKDKCKCIIRKSSDKIISSDPLFLAANKISKTPKFHYVWRKSDSPIKLVSKNSPTSSKSGLIKAST